MLKRVQHDGGGVNVREKLKSLLREPFVQFLLGGLLLFLFFAARGTAVDPADRRITITETEVARLTGLWVQTWRRPPTQAEIDGLIRDAIKEDIYYREAMRLGLDKDDPVIRRRLRSKMEFLATAEAEAATPSEAILQAWLDGHSARYATGAGFAFEQVYAGSDVARAASLLKQLQGGAEAGGLGDPLSVPRHMDADQPAITREFGDGFATALTKLPIGEWSGPVQSGFGLHLVRVNSVRLGRKAALVDVRQQVENDWRSASREEREARAYQALLDGYDIRIEKVK